MEHKDIINLSIRNATLAAIILLVVYVSIVTLVSGWDFAKEQISTFWYFNLILAIGFGIQVGLYTYLKSSIRLNKQNSPSKVLAVSGTTSTVAMISCCAHYLVNVLPILGAVGIITVISSYQIQLFWVGIILNALGIVYMSNKVYRYSKGV